MLTDYGKAVKDLNKILSDSNFKYYDRFHINLHNELRELNLKELYPRIEYNYYSSINNLIKPPLFELFRKYWDFIENNYTDPD